MFSHKRLLVLADDFSGACEIAGIISRYGRRAEIQTVPDLSSSAEAVVVDLDTRYPDKTIMEARMTAFIPLLQRHADDFIIFKKVDSVFRGHILHETDLLLDVLNKRRILLLPANPATGRTINNGRYFVNGELLHTTHFSEDPHFPKTTSDINAIIDYNDIRLPHIHLDRNTPIPASGLLTADIASVADLDHYTSQVDEHTLCSGGAQCFASFAFNVMHWQPVIEQHPHVPPHRNCFIINGSTVTTDEESVQLRTFGIKRHALPGSIHEHTYRYDPSATDTEINDILDREGNSNPVYLHVDQPIHQEQNISKCILQQLVQSATWLFTHCGNSGMHLLLSGGATAAAVLSSTGVTSFEVVTEHAQGVVTIRSATNRNYLYTVKPGSYPWPDTLFKHLVKP